jgi:hypothetical protein
MNLSEGDAERRPPLTDRRPGRVSGWPWASRTARTDGKADVRPGKANVV